MCKCMAWGGVLWIIAGILLLLQDLGVWAFWNISWYTVVFILGGIMVLGMSCCGCGCQMEPAKPAKKK